MKNIVLALISVTLLAPTAASAKPYHLTPVRWIVETRNNISEDDKYVTIIGHVTRRISDEEYWFTDGTGSIRLDSENFDLPIGRRIAIGGRIDQAYLGIGHIEVDVRKWHDAPLPKRIVAVSRPAPVTIHSAPAPTPHEVAPAPALAPAPEPAPAPVTTTPPPAPPAAPPTATTSTTMNPSPVSSAPVPAPPPPTNASPLTPPPETK